MAEVKVKLEDLPEDIQAEIQRREAAHDFEGAREVAEAAARAQQAKEESI